jgi:hypothetical protein
MAENIVSLSMVVKSAVAQFFSGAVEGDFTGNFDDRGCGSGLIAIEMRLLK